MTFRDLNIIEPILKAIEEKGYIAPTSIQEKAIPAALAKRDILGVHKQEQERPLRLQFLLFSICRQIKRQINVRVSKH